MCPFRRNHFLACVVNIIVYMSLRSRGHSMHDTGHVLDIQGEDSYRFSRFVIKLFHGVEY